MKMVMIPCLRALIYKANANKIPSKTDCSVASQNRVSLDHPPPTWPGRQAIQLDCLITIPTPDTLHSLRGGEGGLATERKGGGGWGSQVKKMSRILTDNHT
jgi:hypothetical protein